MTSAARGEHENRHRYAEQRTAPGEQQRRGVLRGIDDVDRRDPVRGAINDERGRKRDEQRRRLDESDHDAVDAADRDGDGERQHRRPERRQPVLVGDEGDAPRARHERDLAQVDAAADDDQPHAEAEDAEN